MKCPHCLTDFHDSWTSVSVAWPERYLLRSREGHWEVSATKCPSCESATIHLVTKSPLSGAALREIRVWPKGVARTPLPKDVPAKFADDYQEACLVLSDSPKASAALSRRCLQLLLRERAGVKPQKLHLEIDEVIKSGQLPPYISEVTLDTLRHFGNFAAHPEKDVNTGEVIDVEPGEAESCLDTLEALFDFYFVQPAVQAARKAAVNKKLTDAGKNPIP
jgi:hypothetical protein